MLVKHKKCAKCGEVKPLDEFCKDACGKYGKKSNCRPCARAATRKWQKANPEKMREQNRRWRAANPEKCKVIDHRKYTTNPKKAQEYARQARKRTQVENYANLVGLFGPTCLDCGREYPMQIFEYHHTDPSTKNGHLNIAGWTWERVKTYVENGTVQLCPTCHRLRHFWGRSKRLDGLGAAKCS